MAAPISTTKFSPEVFDEMCMIIATHATSLTKICAMDDRYPTMANFFARMMRDPKLREKYEDAKRSQQDVVAEQVIDIADADDNDLIADANGVLKGNHVSVARAKLRIDTRQTLMKQLNARKYGSKLVADEDGVLTIINALQP